MQLYFLACNRTAALQVFEQCGCVLAEELGVRPDAETLALAERIRTEAAPILTPKTEEPTLLLPELPFVGRATEHGQLVAAYQNASQGKPQVVCVLGEAGIGKTRLTQTFLAWASIQQADILAGRTFEAGGQLPYQPLVAAFRERIQRANAPADILAEVWLAELSRLLPELRGRYPDLPPPTSGDPNLARSHLMEAMAQLGQALARRKPVVLCIDDLQWADAATLEVLPYLCRRWAESQTRLLLLVAMRSETLVRTPRLREWLAQLEREVSLTRLPLRPLTAEATRQLVHALADPAADHQTASQHFSDWLFAETTGQPYFMAETVKMLVEHDILHAAYQHDGHWSVDFGLAIEQIGRQGKLPMPPSVREVILTRLGRVSETAGALLVAGAILGQACSFEQLCQASGIDELAGLPALDELVESQLLVEAADVQRPYTFSHDKIRDVVCAEAGEARRRLYHRRAFAGLQTDAAPAAELAHHALAGRLLQPAFRYSVAAGDQAAGVYAHVEAAQHYRRALDIVKQDQAGESDEALTGLYLHLGRTLELMSHFEDALASYEEMERFAQAHGDRAMELAALLARITPLATVTAVFDPAHAERLAERALQLAQDLGDQAAEADILWNQLNIYRVTNRLSQAAACGERALTLARRLNLRERLAFVLHDLGYCSAFMADFEPAKALFREAGTRWRESGNLPMVADGLVGACFVGVYSGEYDAAIASFEEALHISQTIGSLWALASCRHNIGYVFSDRGQVERAITEMEEGIRLSEQDGPISPLIIIRADLALLYGALGAVERGMEIARREAEALGARRRLWPILLALSRLEADPTDAERLRQQAREVVAYIADHTPPDLRASFLNLPAVRAVFADD